MLCRNCGKQVVNGSQFCTSCGTPVFTASTAETPTMSIPKAQPQTVEPENSRISDVSPTAPAETEITEAAETDGTPRLFMGYALSYVISTVLSGIISVFMFLKWIAVRVSTPQIPFLSEFIGNNGTFSGEYSLFEIRDAADTVQSTAQRLGEVTNSINDFASNINNFFGGKLDSITKKGESLKSIENGIESGMDILKIVVIVVMVCCAIAMLCYIGATVMGAIGKKKPFKIFACTGHTFALISAISMIIVVMVLNSKTSSIQSNIFSTAAAPVVILILSAVGIISPHINAIISCMKKIAKRYV